MTAQFARGPQPRITSQMQNAPHAALLIDFDNVTMGIRSDLTKELKNLLNSDIIKGKVAVQRAYADWRRYPQYIVPLAENSVDLIFAPAYGSSKKNATDIRLAIDALELVFTRAEIGTFILLSGDSDFSSLVLKLKEYGKYVIGVGIRESSSDLLVQNCDEYYSYSGLTGLTRAGDERNVEAFDPWELVDIAVRQMVENRDVMRSDRLKQILLELDPNFDEKSLGFTKFNRFLQEAATRGFLNLKKMENGQFEVGPAQAQPPADATEPARPERPARTRAAQPAEPKPETKPETKPEPKLEARPQAKPEAGETAPLPPIAAEVVQPVDIKPIAEPLPAAAGDGLRDAYDLLQRAASDLVRSKGSPIRDSDVKRRMLELRPGFDEGIYGFSKFSRFLRQAHDAEVINLQKVENGSYEVTTGTRGGGQRAPKAETEPGPPRDTDGAEPRTGERPHRRRGRDRDRDRRGTAQSAEPTEARAISAEATPAAVPEKTALVTPPVAVPAERVAKPAVPAPPTGVSTPVAGKPGVSLGFRRGSRGGTAAAAPPPFLAGQTIQPAASAAPAAAASRAPETPEPDEKPRARRPARRSETAPARNEDKAVKPVEAATSVPVAPALDQLALPTQEADVVEHLAGYKGVGRKSAEVAVHAFGAPTVFRVMHEQPERVRQTLGGRRAELLLKGWQQDFATLTSAPAGGAARKSRPPRTATAESAAPVSAGPARKTRRGGRKNARKKAGSTRK